MIFYIIPEIRYGIGLIELSPRPMMIITSHRHPAIHFMRMAGAKVWCAEESLDQFGTGKEKLYQAHGLLELPLVQEQILAVPENERDLLTFKTTPRFEKLAATLKAKVLLPQAEKNRFFEDKNKGMKAFLDSGLDIPLKTSVSGLLQEFKYQDLCQKLGQKKLVIQKPRGMAGSTTFFVSTEDEWKKVGEQVGVNPLVKISPYIVGPTYTVNAVISANATFVGYPMLQITGDKRFTRYDGGTSGVDMSGSRQFSESVLKRIETITKNIANVMGKEKGIWGWFGVDFIIDDQGKITVLEVNPRFTASVSIFSQAQAKTLGNNFWGIHIDGTKEFVESMQPLPFTTLIIRNISEENKTIARNFTPGIYHLDISTPEGRLILKKETVFVKDMNNPHEFLIIAKGKDMDIHPDGEIATIVAHYSAVQGESIDEDLGKVANLVTMALMNCES